MSDCHILLLGITRRIIGAITFLQYEFVDNIFNHQTKAVNPKDIHHNIVRIVQAVAKQWPSDKDRVLQIVEEDDAGTIKLPEDTFHASAPKLGVPSGICSIFSRLASCSAS